MSELQVEQIPVLSDNYVYLVHEPKSGAVAVVDPAVSGPVLARAEELGWRITHILNTHHHPDHVGGNLEIKEATGCTIVGPKPDRDRIPGIDVEVDDGDSYRFGTQVAEVFFVPGHTRGHIAYYVPGLGAAFVGDSLFALGCGRLFEGTASQAWASLRRLMALPPETVVYCAHEYTEANLRFALTVDPGNEALQLRAREVEQLRSEGKPTVPTTLGYELETNPFLRPRSPTMRDHLGVPEHETDEQVFARIRKMKDNA